MNSKTYLHKLESDKYLEFKTNEKTFYPTTTSNEFISEFKKFQKFEKKIVETLDLEYGVRIVGIVLNHLGLIQSPEFVLPTSTNDYPYKDAGIEQTWEFAHPNNKIMTGPLKKFKQMIYSKSYEILIRHEKSEITILNETNNKSVYKVYILSKDKKKYYYI